MATKINVTGDIRRDFAANYEWLYDNEDALALSAYKKLMDEGEQLINSHAEIVSKLIAARQEAVCSDREVVALALLNRVYQRS